MQTTAPKPLKTFSVKGPICTVAFFPDGVRVAMGGFTDGSVLIWNLDTGKEEGEPLEGHSKAVTSLAVSKDGNGVVTGGKDGKVLLWTFGQDQKPTSKKLFSYSHKAGTQGVAFDTKSDVPSMVACASSTNLIEVWALRKLHESPTRSSLIAILDTTIQSFSFSDATLALIAVACADKTVRLFDVGTGQQLQSVALPKSILSLGWSLNPARLASTAYTTIYFAEQGNNGWSQHEITGHTRAIKAIDFRQGGKFMATGGDDKVLRIWDAKSRVQIGASAPLSSAITHVVFSPNGKRILAISGAKKVLLWDAEVFGVKDVPPSSSTRRDRPRVSRQGPLAKFFSKYKRFDYHPTQGPTAEFYRMCDYFNWNRWDDARDRAYKGFRKALIEQFNMIYGTDVDNLASWQMLCEKMGVSPIPDSISKCRKIFRTHHVNLVDLVDESLHQVSTFDTVGELSVYTRESRKIFPKENAYAGGLLRYLLREILNPGIGYNFNMAGRMPPHGHQSRFRRAG